MFRFRPLPNYVSFFCGSSQGETIPPEERRFYTKHKQTQLWAKFALLTAWPP